MGGNIAKNKKEEIPKYREKTPCYENRELSWLKFNERVLDEASDKDVPLCERLSFASIFQSNLDEFFMVRVGSLHDQMLFSETKRESKTNMTAGEQLSHIFKAARDLTRKKDHTYRHLMDELKEYGVELLNFSDIEYDDAVYLENYFKEQIMPILSPQVIGKKNPFPFLKNKEIYAVALLGSKSNEKVGLVPCSNGILKRLISIPSERNKYMLVEELILHFMPVIFEKYQIKSKSLIRIIRNADIDVDEAVDDEDTDYRDMMEKLIRQRKKLCPVKMEYSRVLDEKIIHNLCKELNLNHEQIYYSESPLELSFVFGLQDALRNNKNLFYERHIQKNPSWYVSGKPVISQVEEADRFISYPYESMQPFIRMLQEAGEDEKVVSIKMTLYRVAKNSQIVESLISAAENGKEVVVLVELRARFDEENNISWSRQLEEAGCHVVYGIDGLKVHSKLCLITVKSDDGIQYITQIGTGNYNEKTARLYTDLSLMTANYEIGDEARKTFQEILIGNTIDRTQHLLVAPNSLQQPVIDMIEDEIEYVKKGEQSYIGIKVNSLTDKKIMDKLVEASKAGVHIDMVVRGICCLIPGVEGETENIHIRSIVGRYLEHSRIYIFGTKERDKIYISSADFMTRNTLRRVEVAAPVYDERLKERIRNMFSIMLKDNVLARTALPDGRYEIIDDGKKKLNSQEYFIEEAYK